MDFGDEDPPKGAPEWVVTFGDMMSLLMVFFVLLLSFSSMEVEKFKQVAGHVAEAFGVQKKRSWTNVPAGESLLTTSQTPSQTDMTVPPEEDRPQVVLFEAIQDWIREENREKELTADMDEEGITLRADGATFFDSGSAELRPEARTVVDEIVRLAQASEVRVEVEGHTDSLPIATGRYPSNWELSSARAGAVVRHMAEASFPVARLRASGYADTQPVADNDSPEGRSKNRRVEFLFVKEK